MFKLRTVLLFLLVCGASQLGFSSPEIDFRRPSPELARVVDSNWLPLYNLDPTQRYLTKIEMEAAVPMEFLAREELNLAGFAFHTQTFARSSRLYGRNLSIVEVSSGIEALTQGLPDSPVILSLQWAPNGENLAFLNETDRSVELWILDVTSKHASKLTELPVHAAMDQMLAWSSDSQSIWIKTVPDDIGPRPVESRIPNGAIVRVSSDEPTPAQTYQGLLKTQFDVDQFNYFFSSRLARVYLDGTHELFGEPGKFRFFRESPDGHYLLVERLVPPWSYLVNNDQFAYDLEIWDLKTSRSKVIASAPLVEDLPYGGGRVRGGAREFQWRADEPATVVWVEAKDGGDPYRPAKIRDRVFSFKAPFEGAPRVLIETKNRFGDIFWHDQQTAILMSWDWLERDLFMETFDPSEPSKSLRKLMTYEMGDRYRNPGYPILRFNEQGFRVLQFDSSGKNIYFLGDGASEQGDRPFVDRFNIKTKRKKRIFRSKPPHLETPIAVLAQNREELLVKRESQSEPPTHYLWNTKSGFHKRLTNDPNPFPELAGVQQRLLRYKRGDGVNLTATLYLPAGYDPNKDGPLPTLVWAYPKAFQNVENASQVNRSPHEFIDGRWHLPVNWVLRGYAVLDGPTMPIIAFKNSSPNDSFLPQLVNSAKAAVDKLIQMGVSERGRIAIGGSSYGAFMAANLLAHSDLFCAGIARNGAFNRTLTPFGFQSEERSLWEAPRVYLETSPFLSAPQINEPLLLIHGAEDTNPGTYPIQSERLFHALNGLGLETRLVLLPNEGHAIRGRGSIMHLLWEIERWLEIHVKGVSYPSDRQLISQSKQRNLSDEAAEGTADEK